jgi:parvulin-like peptidyl-prolyl isomerase
MPSTERDDTTHDGTENIRDRTYVLWIVVGLLFVAAILGFALRKERPPIKSVARVSHILIECDFANTAERTRALNLADELHGRLLKGESIAKLAREYSDDPYSMERGGDLGWAEKGTYAPSFDEYVWKADIGEVSEPTRTQFGYHLIVVTDRKLSKVDQYLYDQEKLGAEAGEAPAG